jgi:hypothetical protein
VELPQTINSTVASDWIRIVPNSSMILNVTSIIIVDKGPIPADDNADISAAKALIEGTTFTTTQTNASTMAQAKTAVETIISGLNLSGVTPVVVDGVFSAAVAATETEAGVNGSYTFTVNLTKGDGTPQTTDQRTLTIIATPVPGDVTVFSLANWLVERESYTNPARPFTSASARPLATTSTSAAIAATPTGIDITARSGNHHGIAIWINDSSDAASGSALNLDVANNIYEITVTGNTIGAPLIPGQRMGISHSGGGNPLLRSEPLADENEAAFTITGELPATIGGNNNELRIVPTNAAGNGGDASPFTLYRITSIEIVNKGPR